MMSYYDRKTITERWSAFVEDERDRSSLSSERRRRSSKFLGVAPGYLQQVLRWGKDFRMDDAAANKRKSPPWRPGMIAPPLEVRLDKEQLSVTLPASEHRQKVASALSGVGSGR